MRRTMDPEANLKEQLELAEQISNCHDQNVVIDEDDARRLSDLVLAMNGWIIRGGFLPHSWNWKRP